MNKYIYYFGIGNMFVGIAKYQWNIFSKFGGKEETKVAIFRVDGQVTEAD